MVGRARAADRVDPRSPRASGVATTVGQVDTAETCHRHVTLARSRPVGSLPDGRRTVDESDGRLVVDGHPIDELPESEQGRMWVRYAHSSAHDAADDTIVDLLEPSDDASTVVTADRGRRERAAQRGASLMGPQELLRRLDETEGR
jgi:predicted RNA-binding protein with PIN domain